MRKVCVFIVLVGSLLVAACSSVPKNVDLSNTESTVIGSWRWCSADNHNLGAVLFDKDGTMQRSDGGKLLDSGSWHVVSNEERTIQLIWRSGFVDLLVVSQDGIKISGANKNKTSVSGRRQISLF